MKKKLISLLLAASMTFSLTACQNTDVSSETAADESVSQDAAIRVFTDDCGREVEIPHEIARIVPSGPLSQMLLFAIAPEKMVGLSSRIPENALEYLPESCLELPYFGQLYGSADLNLEELALAAPELVIDIGEPKDSVKEDLNAFTEQTTIPSVYISATLNTMPETFRTLGALLHKEEKGEELAAFCEKVYDRTLAIMEKVGENKVRALYILGEEGLNVLAFGSYHAEILDLLTNNAAVIDNPVSKGTGNEVSLEQIALWDPDFILFAPDSIYETADERNTWSGFTAIAAHNYVEIPGAPYNWMGTPPAVQRYLGLIWLTAELYPQYCDYDVKEEVQEYHRLFYGKELTDEQYEKLTANAFTGEK